MYMGSIVCVSVDLLCQLAMTHNTDSFAVIPVQEKKKKALAAFTLSKYSDEKTGNIFHWP